MTDLPRKAVVRGAKLASLPLGMAGRAALGIGKRVGGRPAEVVAAELSARTAEQLFTVLGQLKGGAMKVGQAMSIFEAVLPDDLAGPYRSTLTKLQDSAPALPARTVHGILDRELGAHWHTRFVAFQDQPVAAASIGQVHRATWHDGRDVAVKIQYPGVREALISDLNQIGLFARAAGSVIPGIDVKPLTDELKARMAEELDYRLEGDYQDRFATAFADSPHFAIPRLVTATEHVLVTEWQDGRPLSEVIAIGTPAERDEAAARYLEFLMAGPAVAGLLHADPHPGNFRITPDGRLGIIDFGAVARLPDGLPDDMGRLITAAVRGDRDALLAGLRQAGFVKGTITMDAGDLLAYLDPFVDPVRQPTFTFDRRWLRGLFAQLSDPRRPGGLVGTKINLPPEYLLIHRVWAGGIGVMCQIGGTVPARALVNDYFPGADLA